MYAARVTASAQNSFRLETVVDNADWRRRLEMLLDGAPGYFQLVYGRAANESDLDELFGDRPPSVEPRDKIVLALFEEPSRSLPPKTPVIGCVDLLRGYPTPEVAYIGLLLIDERVRRRGAGRACYGLVEKRALDWGIKRVRLAVVQANATALAFWRRCGFVETGETAAIETAKGSLDCVLFEKAIAP
jgi:GNAT superfamily N-acetyltransferase